MGRWLAAIVTVGTLGCGRSRRAGLAEFSLCGLQTCTPGGPGEIGVRTCWARKFEGNLFQRSSNRSNPGYLRRFFLKFSDL